MKFLRMDAGCQERVPLEVLSLWWHSSRLSCFKFIYSLFLFFLDARSVLSKVLISTLQNSNTSLAHSTDLESLNSP